MDLSLIPRLSPLERTILQASTAKDLFIEKFDSMIEQQQMDEDEEHANGEANVQRSDTAKQAAALQSQRPRDTHEYVSRINFNGHSVPVKVPTAVSSETVGNFSTIKLIQTFSGPHAASPQPFTLHEHLTTNGAYTHPMIVLINAILTQKRVMFLGHNTPSEEVAEAVLAACALASGGVLRGFIRHAFPYTDLTKVDTLKEIPGYVAGVTNPVFATTPDLWDVFCDIQSGRVKISSDIAKSERSDLWTSLLQQNPSVANAAESQAMQPPDFSGDMAFMDRVQRSITDRLGEGVIRSMWRDWIVKFTRMAAAYEEMSFGASSLYIGAQDTDRGDFGLRGHGYVWKDEGARDRELAAFASRIEGWRGTRSFDIFKQDLIHMYKSRPIKTIDLHHHHDRLRTQKLQLEEAAKIYFGFEEAIRTHDEICQLLTITSEAHGGLFYIFLGLLHPWTDVRYRTVELLERLGRHEAGKRFFKGLGDFAEVAFVRVRADKLAREQEEYNNGLSRLPTQ